MLFQAVFRESQAVQSGKPLCIFLEEPIEALQLKQETLLKGIPRLEGNCIKIDITAAIIDKQVRPVRLVCFDQEDCLEGLYHDALAARLEEDTKEGIVEELWDIGLDQHEVTRSGVLRALHEKVTAGIAKEMELTEAQAAALLEKKMTSDTDALEAYVAKERQKIRQKYGHLWKFW